MIRDIRFFLLVSTVLGFFQMDASAMEDFENETTTNKTNILYRKIEELTKTVYNQQKQIIPLIEENKNLKREVFELKEKFNHPKILKSSLSNKEFKWIPYSNSSWKSFPFDSFEGNIKQILSSVFIIPEDGVYSLRVHYFWRAVNGDAGCYTGIAINNHNNVQSFVHHHLKEGYIAQDELNWTTHLKKDEKVMTAIRGHQNAEYYSGNFKFYIEKINYYV